MKTDKITLFNLIQGNASSSHMLEYWDDILANPKMEESLLPLFSDACCDAGCGGLHDAIVNRRKEMKEITLSDDHIYCAFDLLGTVHIVIEQTKQSWIFPEGTQGFVLDKTDWKKIQEFDPDQIIDVLNPKTEKEYTFRELLTELYQYGHH